MPDRSARRCIEGHDGLVVIVQLEDMLSTSAGNMPTDVDAVDLFADVVRFSEQAVFCSELNLFFARQLVGKYVIEDASVTLHRRGPFEQDDSVTIFAAPSPIIVTLSVSPSASVCQRRLSPR